MCLLFAIALAAMTARAAESLPVDPPRARLLPPMIALDEERFDEALTLLAALEREFPSSTKVLMLEAEAHAGRRELDPARAILDRAVVLAPNDPDLLTHYGDLLNDWGDFVKALSMLDRSLRIRPDDAATLTHRALTHLALQQRDAARDDLDAAVAASPFLSSPRWVRAQYRAQAFDLAGALEDRLTWEQTRFDANGDVHVGLILFALRDIPAAEPRLRRVVAEGKFPGHASLWWYLAALQLEGRDAVQAEFRRQVAALPADKRAGWPGPILAVYLGTSDLATMDAAARQASPPDRSDRICEANYYGAQWLVLSGRVEDALPRWQEAERECPVAFFERFLSHAELVRRQRLGESAVAPD
jgi:tetratricopeptide (TPR) repeat protein